MKIDSIGCLPHDKELEPPFGVSVNYLLEVCTFYFISSNQWTATIVSSLFGLSKTIITSITYLRGILL